MPITDKITSTIKYFSLTNLIMFESHNDIIESIKNIIANEIATNRMPNSPLNNIKIPIIMSTTALKTTHPEFSKAPLRTVNL